jgi:predicted MPP superfamily phosphohydrolase
VTPDPTHSSGPHDAFAPPPRQSALKATVRSFLNTCGAAGLALGTLGHSYLRAPFDVEYTTVPMPLRGVGAGLAGYRIAHISDWHTCRTTPVAYLRRELQRVNDLRADLIVMTGDFITHRREHIPLACELAGLLRGPVLAVFGNHDYHDTWETWAGHEVADLLEAGLRERGVTVLRNSAHRLERGGAGLWVVGIEDWWSGRCDVPAAFAATRPDEPIIALAHNADAVFALERAGAQWVLAGHTHGGQIRLPWLGSLMVPQVHKELDRGLFHVGRCRLYVNRGLGFRRRARFRCRPEVTVFELVNAD